MNFEDNFRRWSLPQPIREDWDVLFWALKKAARNGRGFSGWNLG
jgi:hypothetical protein